MAQSGPPPSINRPSALILPPPSLLPLSPASVLVFLTIRGAFPQAAMCFQSEANYSPPLVLFPSRKNTETENCLYFIASIFSPHLCTVNARSDRAPPPSPPLRQTHHAFTYILCVFVSLRTDVCVYVIRQLRNNGFNLPAARSEKRLNDGTGGGREIRPPDPEGSRTDRPPSGDIMSHDLITPPPPFFWAP